MISVVAGIRPSIGKVMIFIFKLIAVLVVLALALKFANPLPKRSSEFLDPEVMAGPGELAEQSSKVVKLHPAQTGVKLFPVAIDSFAARIAMVRAAKRTIDAQYYIWHDDMSGRLLLAEIIAAADRGVRVRLLIDDNATSGLDSMWAAVNSHPNISVRMFNPLVIRRFRPANYLFDFPRLNRRMHNKSLTVDGVATILGGRNVGDEYFGAKDEGLFIDLDAMMIGAVVPQVSKDFDRYWTSDSAYPAETILAVPNPGRFEELKHPVFQDKEREAGYKQASLNSIDAMNFAAGYSAWNWHDVKLFSDDPAKALNRAKRSSLLAAEIAPIIQSATTRFDLVSGYFIPGEFGSNLLQGIARRGVATRVVTNSIQVTDVPIVNAGYAPYRKPLLASGVALFEARPVPGVVTREKAKFAPTSFSGGGESIHAKSFSVDDRLLFVGSFNFDPRSALLNCEMGVIIDAPELAAAFRKGLEQRLPNAAYRLSLDANSDLHWYSRQGEAEIAEDVEPGTTAFQRGLIAVISWLPVEWML